jgi:hypothetical protein
MGKQRKTCGENGGKWWENKEKIVGKWRENRGKIVGKMAGKW